MTMNNPSPSPCDQTKSLAGVEVVASNGKLVTHDIAKVHEITESLFQHIVDIDVV